MELVIPTLIIWAVAAVIVGIAISRIKERK
jgi:hypothetical protein